MCIILHEPANTELPDISTLETCFSNNSDGAGFMYQHDNQVHIQKGFMTFNSLITALNQLQQQKINITNINLTIHFRLASHGRITAELISHATKSKFIIMSPYNIQLIGEFILDEYDQCYYSNDSYIPYYDKEEEKGLEYFYKQY